MPFKIFILDDHPVVAMGLRIEFAGDQRFQLVGHATGLERGLEQARNASIDALILDLVFDGRVRLDIVPLARSMFGHAAIVIFSSLPARVYAADTHRRGADAYVMKDFDIAHLASVVEDVCAARERATVPQPMPSAADVFLIDGVHLTRREAQIAFRLGRGLDIADIAVELAMSPRTVSVHRDSLRRKMKCGNSRELIAQLIRLDATTS